MMDNLRNLSKTNIYMTTTFIAEYNGSSDMDSGLIFQRNFNFTIFMKVVKRGGMNHVSQEKNSHFTIDPLPLL
jgi:hypothetical protein